MNLSFAKELLKHWEEDNWGHKNVHSFAKTYIEKAR